MPIGILSVLVLGLGYLSARPKGSDAEQVTTALNESIRASKSGQPGGVLDQLSDAFQVNNQGVTSTQIAKAIRQFKPDVEVLQPKPTVSGDEANVASSIKLTAGFAGQSQSFVIPGVVFAFHRDTVNAWLIFPVSKWRMTKIQVPPDALNHIEGAAALSSLGSGQFGF